MSVRTQKNLAEKKTRDVIAALNKMENLNICQKDANTICDRLISEIKILRSILSKSAIKTPFTFD